MDGIAAKKRVTMAIENEWNDGVTRQHSKSVNIDRPHSHKPKTPSTPILETEVLGPSPIIPAMFDLEDESSSNLMTAGNLMLGRVESEFPPDPQDDEQSGKNTARARSMSTTLTEGLADRLKHSEKEDSMESMELHENEDLKEDDEATMTDSLVVPLQTSSTPLPSVTDDIEMKEIDVEMDDSKRSSNLFDDEESILPLPESSTSLILQQNNVSNNDCTEMEFTLDLDLVFIVRFCLTVP